MKNFSYFYLSFILLVGFVYSSKDKVVDEISTTLNLNKTASVQFVKTAEKINNLFENVHSSTVSKKLSLSQCKNKCSKVNEKLISIERDDSNIFTIKNYNSFLEQHDLPSITINSFFDKCISKCQSINDTKKKFEKKMKETNYLGKMKKPKANKVSLYAANCDSISNNIRNVNEYKGFGIYRQYPERPNTALSQADGCSIPGYLSIIGLSSEISEFFRPACNSHDICYACQKGQSFCDEKLDEKMKQMCKDAYYEDEDSFWSKLIGFIYNTEYSSCLARANEITIGLKLFGSSSYDAYTGIRDTSEYCAFCGNPVIKDTLFNIPFYTYSDYLELTKQ